MDKIVIIQKMIKQNQKKIMIVIKEGYKNKQEIVTEIFLKKLLAKNRIKSDIMSSA